MAGLVTICNPHKLNPCILMISPADKDQKYRASWHDYKARCIYFITLKKAPDAPSFGKITGDPALPSGTPGCAGIQLSTLGSIVKNAIYNISRLEPRIRLFQYAMMPDHVHFLISVEQTLDESLGLVIARLKAAINNTAGHKGIFQEGYNDQILRRERNLNDIFNYIRDNPRRLAMRMANPEYFRLCSEGRLLMVYPLDLPEGSGLNTQSKVTRALCLIMNRLAAEICSYKSK